MEFQLGIVLGLITLLAWSMSNYVSKSLLNNKISIWLIFFLSELASAVIAFIIAVLTGNLESIWVQGYWIVIGLSVMNFIAMYFFYKALSLKRLSLSVPIIYSYVIITVLLSVVFYSELLKQSQYIAITMIILGIILLTFKTEKKMVFSLDYWYPFVAMIFFGVYYFLLKIPTNTFNSFTIAWSVSFFTALILLPKIIENKNSIQNIKKNILIILFIGFLNVIGFVAFLKAITVAPVSIIVSIKSAAPIFSILLAFVFLKEKLNKTEFLSIFLMLAGIIIISI